MDSFTHLALGAVVGDVLLTKRIGKKALWIGALAQSLPDIDFMTAAWMSPAQSFVAHRGFTHSIPFVLLSSLLIAYLAARLSKARGVSWLMWLKFFLIQQSVHLFIDMFNAYGTGILVPFSSERFSFNTLFVADPLFSIWLGAGAVILIIIKINHSSRIKIARAAILCSIIYLTYASINKMDMNREVKVALEDQISYQRFFTTPTPFNSWLHYVVAETDSGYFAGYHSVFDHGPALPLTYFPRNDSLLHGAAPVDELRLLRTFADGYYTVSQGNDKVYFNVFRFGQVAGWREPYAPFIFQYQLPSDANNHTTLQRGRADEMNSESMMALWKRIKGKASH